MTPSGSRLKRDCLLFPYLIEIIAVAPDCSAIEDVPYFSWKKEHLI